MTSLAFPQKLRPFMLVILVNSTTSNSIPLAPPRPVAYFSIFRLIATLI